MVSHDSLGCLAHHYGFKRQGVKGMSDEEPSQKEILSIAGDIQCSHAPYVLYEQSITSKIIDVIKEETDTKPLGFHNLAVLTKEKQNDDSISYQSLMKKNTYVLNRILSN